MFKIITIFLYIVLTKNLFALEVTIPIKIYDTLTKSKHPSIPGSSYINIDKEELNKNNNKTLHSIIEKNTGIKSRSIYGNNSSGSKTTIDIRGMGAQAKSNVLILINGQKLNNIDMSEIDFPSIPLESIDGIEIYKGNAASVVYGDGAIGGAINIITDPDLDFKKNNKLSIATGSFSKNELSWNSYQNYKKIFLNTYFNHTQTDGYRDENDQLQNNITSEIVYTGSITDHFFTFNFSEQKMSTPSDRSQDQLFSDRRGSDTPDDFINSDGFAVFYGSDYNLSEKTNLILNSSFRHKQSFSDLQSTSYPSYNDTALVNYQLTPRINFDRDLFGYASNTVTGVDLQYADYKSYRKENETAIPLHVYDAWQASQSVYSQNSTKINNKFTLGIGFRVQRNITGIGDVLETNAPDYSGWQTQHLKFSDQEINYALNLGANYQLNNKMNIYGRIGNGFRYPNIDDRIGGSGDTSFELDTQKTNDFEIGTNLKYEKFYTNISYYLIEGKNELAYDSDSFENMNINSTRRHGVEINSNFKLSKKLEYKNYFTYAKAKYTDGDQGTYATNFRDRDVPLVPQFSLDNIIEWDIFENTNLNFTVKFQDDMRMESDDENFQDTKIPSYTVSDIDLKTSFSNFLFSLSINNIFDEKYHNYAVASSSTMGTYNAYPEPQREILFSIGYKF